MNYFSHLAKHEIHNPKGGRWPVLQFDTDEIGAPSGLQLSRTGIISGAWCPRAEGLNLRAAIQ